EDLLCVGSSRLVARLDLAASLRRRYLRQSPPRVASGQIRTIDLPAHSESGSNTQGGCRTPRESQRRISARLRGRKTQFDWWHSSSLLSYVFKLPLGAREPGSSLMRLSQGGAKAIQGQTSYGAASGLWRMLRSPSSRWRPM